MNMLFKTKDIGEASYLLAKGQKLERLEAEGKFFWFVFTDYEGSKNFSDEFWGGRTALVDARRFAESTKHLKHLIFQGNKSDNYSPSPSGWMLGV